MNQKLFSYLKSNFYLMEIGEKEGLPIKTVYGPYGKKLYNFILSQFRIFLNNNFFIETGDSIAQPKQYLIDSGHTSFFNEGDSSLVELNSNWCLQPETTLLFLKNFKYISSFFSNRPPYRVFQISKSFRFEKRSKKLIRQMEFSVIEAQFFSKLSTPQENIITQNSIVDLFYHFIARWIPQKNLELFVEPNPAFYSKKTIEIYFKLDSFSLELGGIADRLDHYINRTNCSLFDNFFLIEASFGIDRIIYSIFQSYFDGSFLNIPWFTPYDYGLVTHYDHNKFEVVIKQIQSRYPTKTFKIIRKGSIGKKYNLLRLIGQHKFLTIDDLSLIDYSLTMNGDKSNRISLDEL